MPRPAPGCAPSAEGVRDLAGEWASFGPPLSAPLVLLLKMILNIDMTGERDTRRRLWDLEPGFLCIVLGAGLGPERTRRILRKAKVPGLQRLSDFEVHGVAIDAAKHRGPVGKLLHKALDRTHADVVRRYASLETRAELARAWRIDQEGANVGGPLWALMTHPASDPDLRRSAYQHAHMRAHEGERERTALSERLVWSEALRREADEHRDRAEAYRRAADERAEALQRRVAELEASLAGAVSERDEALRRSPEALEAAQRARVEAEAQRDAAQRRFEKAQVRIEALERALTERAPPEPAAAPAPALALVPDDPCDGCAEDCADCDLGGGTVLYVGGERSMLPHLRARAAGVNARLLHHDGGREDRLAALPRLCAKADAIVCPMDRVGHAAIYHVKRACDRSGKTFVPLRRASVEAFGEGLLQLADRMAS